MKPTIHATLLLTLTLLATATGPAHGQVALFSDDFESGLDGWEISDPTAITIIDSGEPDHGRVLRLAPSLATKGYALIEGSERWRGTTLNATAASYRIEGEVLFPDDVHNYLGLIYNFAETGRRVDLGSLYIKGNGSYIRVNPRRDWNPARMLYEEYRTGLTGDDAIRIGEWQRFAAEVRGRICHFYVGDLTVPKVTFDFYERLSGKAGFKPRVVGGEVWLDNVRAVAIDALSYRGARQPPGIDYDRTGMVTDWEVFGPLTRTLPAIETAKERANVQVLDDGVVRRWRPFPTDPRGAVVSGQLTDFLGHRTVVYLRTTIRVAEGERAALWFSSIDDLAIWSDGIFDGYLTRGRFAWHDFGRNPEHPPTNGATLLEPGEHLVLVRVRGGQYATGGFFARVTPATESP